MALCITFRTFSSTTFFILSKKYGFNDKLIKKGIVEIEQVKKGYEFLEFKIENINQELGIYK